MFNYVVDASWAPPDPDGDPQSGQPSPTVSFVHDAAGQVVEMIDSWWVPDWYDRGVHYDQFSEVNPNYNDEMPAALIELAFHDTVRRGFLALAEAEPARFAVVDARAASVDVHRAVVASLTERFPGVLA